MVGFYRDIELSPPEGSAYLDEIEKKILLAMGIEDDTEQSDFE